MNLSPSSSKNLEIRFPACNGPGNEDEGVGGWITGPPTSADVANALLAPSLVVDAVAVAVALGPNSEEEKSERISASTPGSGELLSIGVLTSRPRVL